MQQKVITIVSDQNGSEGQVLVVEDVEVEEEGELSYGKRIDVQDDNGTVLLSRKDIYREGQIRPH